MRSFRSRANRSDRLGFTLIELLVVVAIIAILVSLTSAAVFKVWGKGRQVQTKSEINQLATAVVNFQANWNVQYMPSKITVSSDPANIDPLSRTILTRIWGNRLNFSGPSGSLNFSSPMLSSLGATIGPTPMTLAGDQCLVFFLSQLPDNPNNVATPTFKPALFEFKTKRLIQNPNNPAQFPSYADAYEKVPYIYYSSRGTGSYMANDIAITGIFPCQTTPFSANPPIFYNQNSFQIISAGADQKFGPGGPLDPTTGYGPSGYGADDLSNFSSTILGAPIN